MKVEVFSILLGEKQADGILLDSPPDLHLYYICDQQV